MSSFLGDVIDVGPGKIPAGLSAQVRPVTQWTEVAPQNGELFETLSTSPSLGVFTRGTRTAELQRSWDGQVTTQPADDFLEKIIVLPRRFDFGVVFADQTTSVRIYNAYRYASRILTAFVNNAGFGVDIPDLPSLPYALLAQTGLQLTLTVSANGPANVIGSIDFTFDTGSITVPLTAQRALVLPFEPMSPMTERLEFRTDVMEGRSGIEQRRSMKLAPGQVFDMTFAMDSTARQLYDSLIFDVHSRIIGVPVWFEAVVTTSKTLVGAEEVQVQTSAYADFRVGDLAILWWDETLYEALEVTAINPTSIEVNSPFTKEFPRGARFMPIRVGFPVGDFRGEKHPQRLQTARLIVKAQDNDVDHSDASAFPTFGGRVLVDEPNRADPTAEETWSRQAFEVDSETGVFSVYSDAPNARRSHSRTFVTRTRQRLWEVRQLLHFLRGRQTSFWVPTDAEELTVTQDVSSGGTSIDVENVGFTRFVKARFPRKAVRIILTDGTKIDRLLTGSTELDQFEERLTISGSWPQGFTKEEVDRLEYFERVRIDSDQISLKHYSAIGDMTVQVPVIGVYE